MGHGSGERIGEEMSEEKIYLLIRADDIGSSHAANMACIDVYRKGIVRSVEIMVPCPWFPEAVVLLKENPGYDVGVHLTTTSEWSNMKWRPVTHAPSLVDGDGYFFRTFWPGADSEEITFASADWKIEEVERELRAQIELAMKHLPGVSHMGYHMGGARVDSKIGELYDRLEEEYGLVVDLKAAGFQRFPGFGENSSGQSPEEKRRNLADNLEKLGPGKWMFVDHPAYDTPEMRAIHHPGYENVAMDRQGVTEAWTDEKVKEIVERKQIELVSYADVKG
jgi:predicted glycoside hydrolase/deacetylase ChbG (UPF0249 family)